MKMLVVLAALLAGGYLFYKPLPPGKGPNAAAGMRAGGTIVQVLEGYRSSRGMYPQSLEDMVPEYLAGVPHLSNGSSFEYERLGANFKLTFNYTNPLPVHCSYQPATRWACEWF
ncbi:MAG: hypothetical protein IPI92_06315 [Gemmatimonadetes bacterium]|jgi:hypothetical protein|nr:hypothetical protein [Gemmatimonadota bacterium]MBK7784092.1 hypothetical protein [Gemmatimonadota bacterium]MBK9067861.1 hypothetical protein [Gemmatimonadota bacterium]